MAILLSASFLRDSYDFSSAGGSVNVVEWLVIFGVRSDQRASLSRDVGIDSLRRARQNGDICRHLGVVIRIGVIRV